MNQEIRNCQNCKQDFVIEPDDFAFYEKIKVPPPTWCPDCRFQRRCTFRNERKLFKNKDAITGKSILSIYPPEAVFPIYEDSYWASDNWDPFSYGVDFDRSRPFLAQFYELSLRVPHPRADAINMVRSGYSANAADLKDCYLIFNSSITEDSAYGNAIDSCKNCFDNSHCEKSERCYGSFWLLNCHRAHFCSQCVESFELWFCKDCLGCSNCFGCMNLRNKKYCIFNVEYAKEEYVEKIAAMKLNSWKGIEKARHIAHEFWKINPNKYHQGVKNINSTGAYVTHSKNVRNGYLVRGGENLAYVQYGQTPPLRDSMDMTVGGWNSELLYESSVSGYDSSQIRFGVECWDGGMDFEYSMFCGKKSSHTFGCISINSGEYVILNKRYTKEEFNKLRDEIRKHMDEMPYIDKKGRAYKYGEFFPPEFSPFAYNDTIAPEHFPLSKEEILSYGANWYEIPKTDYVTTMSAEDLPNTIEEVKDDILDAIISCTKCKRAFRIIKQELEFLRREGIPLPRHCVDCRHSFRIAQRLPSKLWRRKCMKPGCPNEFETSYALDRPEITYCEQCYNSEVA